jgi:hypothetical protein
MHITINHASQFRDQFAAHGRKDQFSYEALGVLFDYLEEVAPEYELDVIELCCEYSEEMPSEIAVSYGVEVDSEDDGEILDAVMAYLDDKTSVVGVTSSGAIVYACF